VSKKQASVLDHYPEYALNIGIEVHVQLNTKSKIFCASDNQNKGDTPNSCICNICAGYPGVLPVLNKEVVNFGILAGLGTHCTINRKSAFARKHYFYPDLPKGYQTTQDKEPICSEGYIPIRLEDGSIKKIRLIRIHIEEDAGKNIHAAGGDSFVDLNRAGTPLLEIVSYPDIESTYEAKAYLKALHQIVTYLGICTGNMEEGAFRADTNISVRKKECTELGTRCEMKNINSFKFIGDAIEYEIERQIGLLENGERVVQQTRLWDTHQKISKPMRSKEEAADYRYFPDPDLPIIEINEELIDHMRSAMPELPFDKFNRLVKGGINPAEAEILVDNPEIAVYFDAARQHTSSKQLINWIVRDLIGYLKEHKIDLAACKVTPEHMAEILELIDSGKINAAAAKEVFFMVAQSGEKPTAVVQAKGLEQIGSTEELEAIVKEIVASNPQQVAELKAGKDRMFGFFVGLAMKKTQGKGNPNIIQELLKKHLQ
jgi:aspartyl-tRNA(Asn)/glutamyl-tRNA(Gln) amidotransferase subunit B